MLTGLFSACPTFSQDKFNTSYPRLGLYCYYANGYPAKSIGTSLSRLSRYDLLMVDCGRDGAEYFAAEFKRRNPSQILLVMGKNGLYTNDPPQFFLYRSYRGRLLEAVVPGQREIKLDHWEGIYTPYDLSDTRFLYLVIDNEIIHVERMTTAQTFLVSTDTSSFDAINKPHAAGAIVMSPLRMPGPGIFPNQSPYCEFVDGKQAWQYLAEKNMRAITALSTRFDGLFHDYFSRAVYLDDFDFDLNGVNDRNEHGNTWINSQWTYGSYLWLAKEKELIQQYTPEKANVLSVNAGGTLETGWFDYLNGHLYEGFLRWGGTSLDGYKYFEKDMELWIKQGQKPSIMMIADYIPEKWVVDAKEKNNFSKMRFGLATSMIYECYYAMTFGDFYYMDFWYDEYDCDMGFPVDDRIIKLANGLVLRYFTNGVVVSNPTGAEQTLHASDLSGGPYYRMRGGQCPTVNTGEPVGDIVLWGTVYNSSDWRGDGILLFRRPTTVVSDIIVDNFNLNDTSPGSRPIEFTGTWTPHLSKGAADLVGNNPYWCQLSAAANEAVRDQAYGYHAAAAGNGSSTAVWRPSIGVAGWYEISEWHGWHGDYPSSFREAASVPFEVIVGGQTKVRGTINQTVNIGQWNRLCYVYFPNGTESLVRISNKADGVVLADAMRFHYMGDDYVPHTTPPSPPKNVKLIQLP